MANHASTRTTQLYDRRAEEVTLDEVERILVRDGRVAALEPDATSGVDTFLRYCSYRITPLIA